MAPAPLTRFVLPATLEASAPPERRGLARDGVRLLVSHADALSHHLFHDLPGLLNPGDLLVVNTSATLPAALTGRRSDGTMALIHVAGWLDAATWIVEMRRSDNRGAQPGLSSGDTVDLAGHATLTLVSAYPERASLTSRLWLATATDAGNPILFLREHGRPISYAHQRGSFPLGDHQNVYADQPGSAEMASAGRPFTMPLVMRLVSAGVTIAPITLHCGVSSAESHEPPAPERYEVPESTARLVRCARDAGARIIAVGTTVVRALETVAGPTGGVSAGKGWTSLVLGPQRAPRVVTGLITGLHLPESSHLSLLEAVAGRGAVAQAYDEAVRLRYLWHEFGDSMLFLP